MKTRKLLSLVMALMLAVSIAAPMAALAENNDYWEIQVYSELSNFSGLQTGWFAKLLKDKFNVGFNIINSNEGGSDRFATQMISGNLGDLIFMSDANSQKHLTDAIEAGLILDMAANGVLEKSAPIITNNYGRVLEKAKALFGAGEKVYALGYDAVPSNVELEIEGGTDSWWGPYGRWDLYAKLGYPEMNSLDDLLAVLKDMHDLEPVTEDGLPVYAMSLWKDWDGGQMMAGTQFYPIYGYDAAGYVFNHATEDKTVELLDEDGLYLKTLRFYYELNQAGLLDPDSITQTFSEVTTKEQNGQVLYNWFNPIKTNYNTKARLDAGKAVTLLPFENQTSFGYTYKPYGGGRTVSIGANCAQPERLMKIIDWAFSDEGMMEIYNGPKDVTWTISETGEPILTELGWATFNDQMAQMPEEWGGGTYYEGSNKGFYVTPSKNATLALTGYSGNRDLWPCVLSKDMPPIVKDWSDHMDGALTSIQALIKTNRILKTVNQALFSTEPTPQMDEMLQQKNSQIGTVLVQYSWKMALAADDAEYESLKKEMIEKANGLGYAESVAFGHILCDKMYKERKIMLESMK